MVSLSLLGETMEDVTAISEAILTKRKVEETARRSRGISDYLVFRKLEPGQVPPPDADVYVLIGERRSRSRKDAIKEQARDDDSDGSPYGAVATVDFTDYAPTKKIEWE